MARALPVLAWLVLASPAWASPYAVRLSVRQCQALAPAQVAGLGPEWMALAPFVQQCTVADANARPAVSVDVVRLDLADRVRYFNTHADQKVPNPVLREISGRQIGTLPEGFPIDPPGALRVTFADWRGGVPRRIDLFEAGVSAVSPHAVSSLHWDAARRVYR